MFYNIYKDLRVQSSIIHILLWIDYPYRNQAINGAKFIENTIYHHQLKYVKTIEIDLPSSGFDMEGLSIYDKDRIWNQILPEVHFYCAGHTQYK